MGIQQSIQDQLIQLFLQTKVLQLGNFTTKSGRASPYFLNIGKIASGMHIWMLAKYYAKCLIQSCGEQFDNLYGPAYKGIPLAAVTASVLFHEFGLRNITFTFNRKETKDHGEGGNLIGYHYQGSERVVIIEDVLTAGTSVHESIQILRSLLNPPTVVALLVAVDRGEIGQRGISARQELEETYGIQVISLLHISDLICYIRSHLGEQPEFTEELLSRIQEYQQKYCCG